MGSTCGRCLKKKSKKGDGNYNVSIANPLRNSSEYDLGGTRFNISSAPEGESLPVGTADPHYGLEHFGLHTDNIEATMAALKDRGTEVLLPITQVGSGNKIAYVKGPDDVRIELVQPST